MTSPYLVQLLSYVWLFVTPWTAALQASLSFTISQSLLKRMSIVSMIPSNHLILCHPLLLWSSIFPTIRVISNESVFALGDQSIGASASAPFLSMNIQDWFPLGLTGLISLLSKGLLRVVSNTTVRITLDAKNWLLGKNPDAEKDWRQEAKGMTEDEMVGQHHLLNGHEFEHFWGTLKCLLYSIDTYNLLIPIICFFWTDTEVSIFYSPKILMYKF